MLIGSQYHDNRMYRGIRHYDSVPLSSEDIHEYSDTVFMKNAYIMNNIVGCGTLNAPEVELLSNGIKLREPVVLLIDGDISLIQSDDNSPIVYHSQIANVGVRDGVVCVVGWYQHLLASSTLRNYGGVDNSIIENNLLDNEFEIQISSRYQFRWTTVLLSKSVLRSSDISFELPDRDAHGNILDTTSQVRVTSKVGNVFIADEPATMEYSESPLYIVPVLEYEYDTSSHSVTSYKVNDPIATKGSSHFIESEEEPEGEYTGGTTWYNPTSREFKTYVPGVGFVSSASTMGFLQHQSVYEMPEDVVESSDILVPIGISSLEDGDILRVTYEGLFLVLGEHYTVDYETNSITLLDFTVSAGDKVTFTSTKIVEASDVTNITATFLDHITSRGSGTVESHVRLSDTADESLGENSGVAATPKSVHDATLLVDPETGLRYRLGVINGMLYVEEV